MNISYTPDTHRYTQIGTDGYICSSVSGPTCQIHKIIIMLIIIIIIIIIKIIDKSFYVQKLWDYKMFIQKSAIYNLQYFSACVVFN